MSLETRQARGRELSEELEEEDDDLDLEPDLDLERDLDLDCTALLANLTKSRKKQNNIKAKKPHKHDYYGLTHWGLLTNGLVIYKQGESMKEESRWYQLAMIAIPRPGSYYGEEGAILIILF